MSFGLPSIMLCVVFSKGRRMERPKVYFSGAPSSPAFMMPSAAPVIQVHFSAAIAALKAFAAW